MLDELRMFARYATGLREFLRHPLGGEECRRLIQEQFERRAETFLEIVRRGICGNPRSPYGRLLRHAGAEFGDVAGLVRTEGVEGALGKLYQAGVYITIEEFKGRKPIERAGLSLAVRARDFDNPWLARQYEMRTGGSRGVGSRVTMDLDYVVHEAAYYKLFAEMFGLEDRAIGLWREVPPSAAAVKGLLRYGKLGRPIDKWFTQHPPEAEEWRFRVFTAYTVWGIRRWGAAGAWPEHVPAGEAGRVARWLAEVKTRGRPALLDTHSSSGVQVCLAAREQRLDIAGTFLRLGGEPYTAAKARVVAQSGCEAACNYHTAETGVLGMTCGARAEPDEVHLVTESFAVIQREKPVGAGVGVGALVYTSLLPSSPKILLNVEMGDYGVLQERRCGCLWEELGMKLHLHGIRSYEKLTSAGMTFLGSELLRLVEEVLPGRFGGGPADYQFVEEEESGVGRVSLVMSPRLGEAREAEVVETVLRVLEGYPGGRLMAGVWRDGGTLRVERREPYLTATAKILPLHILRKV